MRTSPSLVAARERPAPDAAAGLPVLGLILVLAAVGVALYAIGGPPQLPGSVPDAGAIVATLRSSDVPVASLGYVLIGAAWLVWAWLLLSMALRVIVDVAEIATRGARWVVSLRTVSDRITLPVVRKVVDGALAAVLVANIALRTVPIAAAEPLTSPTVSMTAPVETTSASVVPRSVPNRVEAVHVVRSGETLWSLAERYYGSGREYPRIVDANLGRPMTGGQSFSPSGVLEPGWSLRVPLPNDRIEEVDGAYFYTVERGDTLWGISGRLLGDETRWPELFDANRNAAQLADGRMLKDPDLIWPELRLRLPLPIVGIDEEVADADEAPIAAPAVPQDTSAPAAPAVPAPLQSVIDGAQSNNDMTMAVGGTAGALTTAAALVWARRRGRRDLLELPLADEPESDMPIRGGFAEPDLARDLVQDLPPHHPAIVLAGHVQRLLAERALSDAARLFAVRYGRTRSSVVLDVRSDSQAAVRNLAPILSTRLGVPVTAQITRDHDVGFDLGNGQQLAGLAAVDAPPPMLIPMLVTPDRRELWVSPDRMGHVLATSLPGPGADVVVTALVASLAVRSAPGELKLWTIGAPQELPRALDGLPQTVKARSDSRNALQVDSALRDVRAELIRRMQRPATDASAADPEVVLLVGELAAIDYETHRTTLDMLMTYGSAHGVRVIAATHDSAHVADGLLGGFATRLVLRTATTEESERLLGQPDAADLLGGGQLWARFGERRAQEAYGLRIRPDALERVVRVLRSRHGLPPLALTSDDAEQLALLAGDGPKLVRLDDVDGQEATAEVIQVRCFGGFEVRGPAGELVPSVEELGRGAAWDVLAVLAASAEGTVATSELVERLWPGLERGQADDALRRALTSLRELLARATHSLHAEAVRFGPGEACQLDTRVVVSDVHRFLRLCRAAPFMPPDQAHLAWQRARALYRGALLDGPGARAWTWATQQDAETGTPSMRDRYREHAYQATRGLARLAAAGGRLDDAVMLYQELLSVEPMLEDVVRELCACYEQLDDAESILREETRLRRALHAAYVQAGPGENPMAYEPEPATVAMFERARRAASLSTGRAVVAS